MRRAATPALILMIMGALFVACQNERSGSKASTNPHSVGTTSTDGTVIDGIRFAATPAGVVRGCRQAQRLTFDVYCPKFLPRGWSTGPICVGCNGTFSITGFFIGPPGYVGVPGSNTGHLNIWASPREGLAQLFVGCVDGKKKGFTHEAGRTMAWIVCPPGSELDSGHLLLQWRRGRVYYGLSLHSNTPANRALLRFMASHLIRIRARHQQPG